MTYSNQEAFSIGRAAAASDLGRTFLFEQIRAGRLRARKAGRRTIILTDDLRAFLAALPPAGDAGADRGAAR